MSLMTNVLLLLRGSVVLLDGTKALDALDFCAGKCFPLQLEAEECVRGRKD